MKPTLNDEIARRLKSAAVRGSPNLITAKQLREWTVKYLADYDEELQRFPKEKGKTHWNLLMMDGETENALFAVLLFRKDAVEFFCGTGNGYDVRSFAESDFPSNPEKLLAAMQARFTIAVKSLHIARPNAEKWLKRSW